MTEEVTLEEIPNEVDEEEGPHLKPLAMVEGFSTWNMEMKGCVQDFQIVKAYGHLKKMKWENLLEWGGNMIPSTALRMFRSIKDFPAKNHIRIEFQGGSSHVITPELVSDVMGISMVDGYIPKIPFKMNLAERPNFAKKLCGKSKVTWTRNI